MREMWKSMTALVLAVLLLAGNGGTVLAMGAGEPDAVEFKVDAKDYATEEGAGAVTAVGNGDESTYVSVPVKEVAENSDSEGDETLEPVGISTMKSSEYFDKVKQFVGESPYSETDWSGGKNWNNGTSHKLGSWSASGCAGYAHDFTCFMFGCDGSFDKLGVKFTDINGIQNGDVVYFSDHYFCVLNREDDGRLWTAEGNYSDHVRVDIGYSIKNGTLYQHGSNKSKTFSYGWHFVNVIPDPGPINRCPDCEIDKGKGDKIKEGRYVIASKYSFDDDRKKLTNTSYAMEADGSDAVCTKGINDKTDLWDVQYLGDRFYSIRNVRTGKYLSLEQTNKKSKTNCNLTKWYDDDCTVLWAFFEKWDGQYTIENQHSEMPATKSDGDSVKQVEWYTKSSDSVCRQIWMFVYPDKPTIKTQSIPNGTIGQAYNTTLNGSCDEWVDITWSLAGNSKLPDGLTLSSKGVISGTPTKPGNYSFTIYATNFFGTTSRNYTINVPEILPTEISLDKDTIELTLGENETGNLTASISPSNASNQNVEWSLDREGTVTLTPNGKNCTITAVKSGEAFVTATACNGMSASCKVAVNPDPNPDKAVFSIGQVKALPGRSVDVPVSITQNPGIADMMLELDYDHDAMALSEIKRGGIFTGGNWSANTDKGTVQWHNDNASVRDTGILFTVTFAVSKNTAEGKCPVSLDIKEENLTNYDSQKVPFVVSAGGVTVGSAPDDVPVQSITLNRSTLFLAPGSTFMLKKTISPADATDKTVTWTSKGKAAKVSENGLVTALESGTATIYATANDGSGVKGTCTVTVEEQTSPVKVTGISLDKTSVKIDLNDRVRLVPEIMPANASDQTVQWGIEDGSVDIAVVDSDGMVTGLGEGAVKVFAKTNDGGFTAYCTVEVHAPLIDLAEDDIYLDTNETEPVVSMLPGEVRRFSVSADGRYIYGIRWGISSANPKGCVTVKNGIVTAKKTGSAEVTAEYRDEKVTYEVNVQADVPDDLKVGTAGNKLSATKTVKLNIGDAAKKITIGLPKALQELEVTPEIENDDICSLGEPQYDATGSKATFMVSPKDAGATRIIWTVTDNDGEQTQAYTKVMVKKPITELSLEGSDSILTLTVGKGRRLAVTGTKDNTDSRELSFSVQGKGIKVSKSGYVIGTVPGATGTVKVKAGKVTDSVDIRILDYGNSYFNINRNSVSLKPPKAGAKPRTAALKVAVPDKKMGMPSVSWSVPGSPEGIIIDSRSGKVSVSDSASPGCYIVTAEPTSLDKGFRTVCCEVVVK